jgi:thioredoxin 1
MSMDSTLVELTDNNFESEVVNSNIPVVVDFYAEWCRPCLLMSPILEDLSKEFEGKVKICRADIETTNFYGRFNISNIPSLLIFKNGIVDRTLVGLYHKKDIKDAMLQEV